ncbi:hypothetical protein AB7A76_05765 [Klebsiella pneumoniae]
MSAAGLHLATVNEFSDKVADIQQPFSRLCESIAR